MKTEVAALMHRDSGLTLIIHNTENPTDTQVSDHLTVTLHIFFSLKKKKKITTSVFVSVFFLQGPNVHEKTFHQARIVVS